jgi:hypothetical protein
MPKSPEARARDERQGRVAKVVWGVTFMVMGTLFTLDNLGRVDMGHTQEFVAGHVVDGDPGTRWSSGWHDNQWVRVDLGAPADITKVKLNWEAAYAKAYRVEVSDDDASWRTIVDVTSGKGGIEEHDVSAHGRYVRVFGTKRSTPYGISLWELEVYGTPLDAGPATVASVGLLSAGKPATSSSMERTNYWFLYWPIPFIAAALPGLIAPKNAGDQVFALCMVGAGVYFQLWRLHIVTWSFSQVWPVLLVLAGFLLVSQSWGRLGKGGTPDGGTGMGTGL